MTARTMPRRAARQRPIGSGHERATAMRRAPAQQAAVRLHWGECQVHNMVFSNIRQTPEGVRVDQSLIEWSLGYQARHKRDQAMGGRYRGGEWPGATTPVEELREKWYSATPLNLYKAGMHEALALQEPQSILPPQPDGDSDCSGSQQGWPLPSPICCEVPWHGPMSQPSAGKGWIVSARTSIRKINFTTILHRNGTRLHLVHLVHHKPR